MILASAKGRTLKGLAYDKARPHSHTCFTHVEFHRCDCGTLVAHCIVHDEGIKCRECGLVW